MTGAGAGARERRRSSAGQPYGRPIEQAVLHGKAVEADTDILDEDVVLSLPPGRLRVLVQVDAATKFYAQVDNGTSEVRSVINRGRDLEENCAYHFEILVAEDDLVNFQFGDAVTVEKFIVHEIPFAG